MKNFYASVDTEPIIYWVFDSAILRDAHLEYFPSQTGDTCHINVHNVTNQEAEEIFINNFIQEDCRICVNNLEEIFTKNIFN